MAVIEFVFPESWRRADSDAADDDEEQDEEDDAEDGAATFELPDGLNPNTKPYS